MMESEMFQPPDPPEPDYDAMREAEYDRYEKLGYAIIARDEWREKLDEAARDGYAEGRKDEREELLSIIRAAGFDLVVSEGREYLRAVHPEAKL
jgi:hypothetical protein